MCRYVVTSISLCESTDMRLTISPTVLVRLALLLSTRACERERGGREGEGRERRGREEEGRGEGTEWEVTT